MLRFILLLGILLIPGCGKKDSVIILEPEPGFTIAVSDMKISKPERRVNGIIAMENKSDSFVTVSNRELFLYYGNDSARAFTALAGTWQIDEGLINIMKGKKIMLQVYWPLLPPDQHADLSVKYVKHLDRRAAVSKQN